MIVSADPYYRVTERTPQYIGRRMPIVRHSCKRGPVVLSPHKIKQSIWVAKKLKEITKMIYEIYHCPEQRDTLDILMDERRKLGKELVDLEHKINNEYEKRLKKYYINERNKKEKEEARQAQLLVDKANDAAGKRNLIKAIEYGDRYATMRAQEFGLDQVVKYWSAMNNFQISNRMLMVKHRQLEIYQNDPEFLVIKPVASIAGRLGEAESPGDSEGAGEQGETAENQAKEEVS